MCIGVPAKRGNSEHNGHSQTTTDVRLLGRWDVARRIRRMPGSEPGSSSTGMVANGALFYFFIKRGIKKIAIPSEPGVRVILIDFSKDFREGVDGGPGKNPDLNNNIINLLTHLRPDAGQTGAYSSCHSFDTTFAWITRRPPSQGQSAAASVRNAPPPTPQNPKKPRHWSSLLCYPRLLLRRRRTADFSQCGATQLG